MESAICHLKSDMPSEARPVCPLCSGRLMTTDFDGKTWVGCCHCGIVSSAPFSDWHNADERSENA